MDALVLEMLPVLKKTANAYFYKLEDAEDCLADFYKDVRGGKVVIPGDFNPQGAIYTRFKFYMMTFADNKIRRKEVFDLSSWVEGATDFNTPEHALILKQRATLASALLKKTTALKARVIKTAIDEDSVAEASRVLKANLETTKRNYYRGLQDLKEYLHGSNHSNFSI